MRRGIGSALNPLAEVKVLSQMYPFFQLSVLFTKAMAFLTISGLKPLLLFFSYLMKSFQELKSYLTVGFDWSGQKPTFYRLTETFCSRPLLFKKKTHN